MISVSPEAARIAIVGAGPGGLTCARVLQRHGLRVTVYERDRDAHDRNQGGTLDLHTDGGQLALGHAGLLQQFFAVARHDAQERRVTDHTGIIRSREVPEADDHSHPEIDRGDLRDLLVNSLQPGTVRWGSRLTDVAGPADGPRLLHFADGDTVEADLVIGADGGFSRVRALVSDAVPAYTGVTFVEAWFDEVDTRHPELSEFIGPGSLFAVSGGRVMLAERNSGEHIRVYLTQRLARDANAAAWLESGDTATIRSTLLELFAGWDARCCA